MKTTDDKAWHEEQEPYGWEGAREAAAIKAENNTVEDREMKSQHTPGPWKLSHTHMIVQNKRSIDGCCEIICEMAYCTGPDRPRNLNEANARLIEAAPDLLAALKAIIERGVTLDQSARHEGLTNCAVIAQARAAIARATGERG